MSRRKRTKRKPTPEDGAVHATIKRLKPGTTYRYWLVARGASGKVEGRHRHFTTEG